MQTLKKERDEVMASLRWRHKGDVGCDSESVARMQQRRERELALNPKITLKNRKKQKQQMVFIKLDNFYQTMFDELNNKV